MKIFREMEGKKENVFMEMWAVTNSEKTSVMSIHPTRKEARMVKQTSKLPSRVQKIRIDIDNISSIS